MLFASQKINGPVKNTWDGSLQTLVTSRDFEMLVTDSSHFKSQQKAEKVANKIIHQHFESVTIIESQT